MDSRVNTKFDSNTRDKNMNIEVSWTDVMDRVKN